jgi:glycosyltransferase involved in cell wall biosynthesis
VKPLTVQAPGKSLNYSIIIPTYNRSALLAALLKSIQSMRIPEDVTWEVIVVDNNSSDDTRHVIDGFIHEGVLPLRYCLEVQQGVGHARNSGIHASRGKILAFVDDDEIVVEDWFVVVHSAFQRYSCAAVGGRVLPRWISPPPDWYTTDGPYRIIGPIQDHDLGEEIIDYNDDVPMPLGGNLAVSRECFDKYGLFRTDLGPLRGEAYAMGEDIEFCLRLLERGERLVYVPAAVAFNAVHAERLTKKFCRSFYFRLGQSNALLRQTTGRRLIGVPRHLFRRVVELMVAWIGSMLRGRSRGRLYFEFQLVYLTGQIYQYLYMSRNRNSEGIGGISA